MNVYCVWCLSYGLRASAVYSLGIPLSDFARDMLQKGEGLNTRSITYFKVEQGMKFPSMHAFVEFVEKFGSHFRYIDSVGAWFDPLAVATYQGNSVCISHLPNFEFTREH